jgi:hypothetical protein
MSQKLNQQVLKMKELIEITDFKEFAKGVRDILSDYVDWNIVDDFMVSNARDLCKEHFREISTRIKEAADEPVKKSLSRRKKDERSELYEFTEAIDALLNNEDYTTLLQLALIVTTGKLIDHYDIPIKKFDALQDDFMYFFNQITEHVADPRVIFPWTVLFLLTCDEHISQFPTLSEYYKDRYVGLFIGIDMELDSIMLDDSGDGHSGLVTRDDKYWIDGRAIDYDSDGRALCPDCGIPLESRDD